MQGWIKELVGRVGPEQLHRLIDGGRPPRPGRLLSAPSFRSSLKEAFGLLWQHQLRWLELGAPG
jgi:hypothetical protein